MPRKKKVEKEMQVWIIPVQNNFKLDAMDEGPVMKYNNNNNNMR